MTITLCPPEPAGPGPEEVSYSFGLPGGTYCVPMVRNAVHDLLCRHGLTRMAGMAEEVTAELLGAAYRLAPEQSVSYFVRWSFGALRLAVFDQHPVDEERRRRQLALLEAAVQVFGGTLGLAPAGPPLGGTRTWVVLPGEGAVRHGHG